VCNYHEQIHQYPIIAQNFQHIKQNQVAEAPKTQPQSPTASSSSSSVLSSPEREVKELRNRTFTTDVQYTKPKSKSWIKQGLAKVKTSPNLRMGKTRQPS
jgi:hypothetical protein